MAGAGSKYTSDRDTDILSIYYKDLEEERATSPPLSYRNNLMNWFSLNIQILCLIRINRILSLKSIFVTFGASFVISAIVIFPIPNLSGKDDYDSAASEDKIAEVSVAADTPASPVNAEATGSDAS